VGGMCTLRLLSNRHSYKMFSALRYFLVLKKLLQNQRIILLQSCDLYSWTWTANYCCCNGSRFPD